MKNGVLNICKDFYQSKLGTCLSTTKVEFKGSFVPKNLHKIWNVFDTFFFVLFKEAHIILS